MKTRIEMNGQRRILRLRTLLALVALGVPLTVEPMAANAHFVTRSTDEISCATVNAVPRDVGFDAQLPGASLGEWLPRSADGRLALRVFWPGDVVRVTASGSIHGGGVFGWVGSHGPEGVAEVAPSGGLWPLPGARKWSLVGGFNDDMAGRRFFLGAGPRCFRWNGTTHQGSLHDETFLTLQFNDDWPSDNSGSFAVHVDNFWCGTRVDC